LFRNTLQLVATVGNPSFTLVNPIRDQQDVAMLFKGIRTPADYAQFVKLYIEDVGHALRQDDEYLRFLNADLSYSGLQKNIRPTSFTDFGQGDSWKSFDRYLRPISRLSNALEEGSKMAGMQLLERQNRGRPLTPKQKHEIRRFSGSPDFGQGGTAKQEFNLLVMFANAQIQGIRRNFQRMEDSPGRMLIATGAMTALAGAQYVWNRQFVDGDGIRAIDRISINDRNNYLTLILPPSLAPLRDDKGVLRHQTIKLPLGHAPKLLYAAGRGAIEMALGETEAGERTLAAVLGAVLPGNVGLDPNKPVESIVGGTISSLNPLINTGVGVLSNYDFSKQNKIVPRGLEGVYPELQTKADTSPFITMVQNSLNAISPQGLKSSPMTMEYITRNLFGGPGDILVGLADHAMRSHQVAPREPAHTGLQKVANAPFFGPIAKRFIGSNIDQQQRENTEFIYDLFNQASLARKSARLLVREYGKDPSTELSSEQMFLASQEPFLAEKIERLGEIRSTRQLLRNTQPPDMDQQLAVLAEQERLIIQAVSDMMKNLEQTPSGVYTEKNKGGV
jgi:hypothetical protein